MEKSSFQIYNEKRLGIRSEELVKELEKDAKDEQEGVFFIVFVEIFS